MNKLLYLLKKYVPKSLRASILSNFNFESYREYSNKKANPFIDDPDSVDFENSSLKVGIIYSRIQYHKFWIAACRDLKISYRIIYLEKNNWIDQVKSSDVDLFLVWPDVGNMMAKEMQDERLRVMVEDMGKRIYPSLKEVWLYENKRVQHYWLKVNNYATPKTWVFYDINEAIEFLQGAVYPLVFKSNLGASASGVYIIKSKREAISKATIFLTHGYKMKGSKSRVRQKGSLYVQEYLRDVKEWRMVRIGDSYFGHGKDMKGQFHSGSGKANWDMPPKEAFDILYEITEKGKFTSMDVDLFEDDKGRFYVNELQTVFGNSVAKEQLKVDGVPGRMKRDSQGNFEFEAGSFCENHLCNLRLQYLLQINS